MRKNETWNNHINFPNVLLQDAANNTQNRFCISSDMEMQLMHKNNIFQKSRNQHPKTNKPIEVSKVPPFSLFMMENFNSSQENLCSNSSLKYAISTSSSISNSIKPINENLFVSINGKDSVNSMSTSTTRGLPKPQILYNDNTSFSRDKVNYSLLNISQDVNKLQDRESSKQKEILVIDISDDEECEEAKVVNLNEISILFDGKIYNEEQECHKKMVDDTSNIKRLQSIEIWQGVIAWNIGKLKLSTNCNMKTDNANQNHIINAEDWCRNQSIQLLPKCDLECYAAALENGICVVLEMEQTFETNQLRNLITDEHTGFISVASSFMESHPLVIMIKESTLKVSERLLSNNQLIFKGIIVSANQPLARKISCSLPNTGAAWQGTLVWKKRLSNCSLSLIHQVSCRIPTTDSLLKVKPSSWSSTFTMQMFPNSILHYFNANSIRGFIVDVELFPGEDFDILNYSLNGGLAGCIHVSYDQPSDDQLKVIILTLNKEMGRYIGFVPSDQDLFCSELKNVIVKYQQKLRGN